MVGRERPRRPRRRSLPRLSWMVLLTGMIALLVWMTGRPKPPTTTYDLDYWIKLNEDPNEQATTTTTTTTNSSSTHGHTHTAIEVIQPTQRVYTFRHQNSNLHKEEPHFLDPIDVLKDLEPIQPPDLWTIDATHRQGLVHMGVWLHVLDVSSSSSSSSKNPKLLLLKRGPQLVTCPNSWGLVGEHTNGDEAAWETAQRAMQEELGLSAMMVDHQQQQKKSYKIHNLTTHPMYYLRHYEDGRIDRQVTYLQVVQLLVHEQKKASLQLDEEVADHQWIHLDDYEQWIFESDAVQDFCHPTIVRLARVGLEKLKEFLLLHYPY